MKKILPIILIILGNVVNAQNLVPNPSFEEYQHCPQTLADLDGNCQYWKTFRATPDYFNNCSAILGFHNPWGYQKAHTGQAYVALWEYQVTSLNVQEQIGVKLNSILVIGTKYYLSFYISSAYTPTGVNIAIDKMGALVTTYQYSDPEAKAKLPNACTIYCDSIIKDTVNWVKIFGSFVADSAYKYLIIGNFFDDKHIDTIHLPYKIVIQASAYYIDDVCLSTDSIYCQNWSGLNEIKNNKNEVLIFPNPTSDVLHIKSEIPIELIQILNAFGQLVFTSSKKKDKEVILSLKFLKPDIYYLKIITTKRFYYFKINIIY